MMVKNTRVVWPLDNNVFTSLDVEDKTSKLERRAMNVNVKDIWFALKMALWIVLNFCTHSLVEILLEAPETVNMLVSVWRKIRRKSGLQCVNQQCFDITRLIHADNIVNIWLARRRLMRSQEFLPSYWLKINNRRVQSESIAQRLILWLRPGGLIWGD